MRFTKKPVTIDAMKFIGFTCDEANDIHMVPQFDDLDGRDADDGVVPDWLAEALTKSPLQKGAIWVHVPRPMPGLPDEEPHLRIGTLEGHLKVPVGWFIIQGVEGEIYPCKPSIFEATYGPYEPNAFELGAAARHIEESVKPLLRPEPMDLHNEVEPAQSETVTYLGKSGDLPLEGQ